MPKKESTEVKSFYNAIRDNFQENIKYKLIINDEQYHKEKEKIIKNFQDNYSDVCDTSCTNSFELLSKQGLDIDFPYIFYIYDNIFGETKVMAFRGNQIGVGIAEKYKKINTVEATNYLKSINQIMEVKQVLQNLNTYYLHELQLKYNQGKQYG